MPSDNQRRGQKGKDRQDAPPPSSQNRQASQALSQHPVPPCPEHFVSEQVKRAHDLSSLGRALLAGDPGSSVENVQVALRSTEQGTMYRAILTPFGDIPVYSLAGNWYQCSKISQYSNKPRESYGFLLSVRAFVSSGRTWATPLADCRTLPTAEDVIAQSKARSDARTGTQGSHQDSLRHPHDRGSGQASAGSGPSGIGIPMNAGQLPQSRQLQQYQQLQPSQYLQPSQQLQPSRQLQQLYQPQHLQQLQQAPQPLDPWEAYSAELRDRFRHNKIVVTGCWIDLKIFMTAEGNRGSQYEATPAMGFPPRWQLPPGASSVILDTRIPTELVDELSKSWSTANQPRELLPTPVPVVPAVTARAFIKFHNGQLWATPVSRFEGALRLAPRQAAS